MDLRSIFRIVTLKDNPKEIYIYNSETGLYESEGYETLRAKIAYVLGNSYSENHARATIYDITAHTHVKREDFTAPIQFIPVENGVLDISKNPVELLDYSGKFYFTKKLPVTYNPKAKCPKFLKFLKEILPEEKFRLQI
jgi:phage/plasmid-associated DNA primase